MRLPSFTEITGLFSTPEIREPEQLYDEALRDLGQENLPGQRQAILQRMAYWADAAVSKHYLNAMAFTDEGGIATAVRWERAQAAKWGHVRDLCRAISATEVGLILVDPRNVLELINGLSDDFVVLAAAADDDDREKRARVLFTIAGYLAEDPEAATPSPYAGVGPFIDDIAATEITAYGIAPDFARGCELMA